MCIKKLYFIAFFALLCSGCSKKGSNDASTPVDERDVTPPVITIVSPTNNQVFTPGQTIHVSATASDNGRLTQLEIHVIDKQSGALLRDIHSYPGASSAGIEDHFVAKASTSYIIKVMAYDARANQAIAQVEVSVN